MTTHNIAIFLLAIVAGWLTSSLLAPWRWRKILRRLVDAIQVDVAELGASNAMLRAMELRHLITTNELADGRRLVRITRAGRAWLATHTRKAA